MRALKRITAMEGRLHLGPHREAGQQWRVSTLNQIYNVMSLTRRLCS